MKQVTKQVFDKFFENNREAFTDVPKWNSKESSVTWKWQGTKKPSCMWVEKDGIMNFYVSDLEG